MDAARSFRPSEGLLVAAAPAVGYVLAYLYRRGFAEELRIPFDLIDVQLRDVLFTTVAAGFIVLVWVHNLANFALILAPKLPRHPRGQLAAYVGFIWLIAMGTEALIYRQHLGRVVPTAAITGLVGILVVLVGPVTPSDTRSRLVVDRLGFPLYMGLMALFWGGVVAHSMGSARALDQTTYPVSTTTGEAVLAIYGDKAVLAPHAGRRLENRFRVVGLSDQDLKLELRRVGPLRPRPVR